MSALCKQMPDTLQVTRFRQHIWRFWHLNFGVYKLKLQPLIAANGDVAAADKVSGEPFVSSKSKPLRLDR